MNPTTNPLQPATLTALDDESRYRNELSNNYQTNYSTVYLTTNDFYRPLSQLSDVPFTDPEPSPYDFNGLQSQQNRPLTPVGGFGLVNQPLTPYSITTPSAPYLTEEQRKKDGDERKSCLTEADRSLAYVISSPDNSMKRSKRILARICGHLVSLLMLLMMIALFAVLIRSFQSGVGTGFHRHARFMYPIG